MLIPESCSEAGRVREAVAQIAEALGRPAAGWVPNPFLRDGHAGLALFFAYLALERRDDALAETAVAYLGEAMSALAESAVSPGLFHGFTGVAWVVEHLRGRFLDSEEDDDLEAIDQSLERALTAYPQRAPPVRGFELLGGLVGLGVYGLERLPRPWAVRFLELVVDRLDAVAEHRDGGVTWWTDSRPFGPRVRERFPRGCYNLGMAHGLPGVIAFLGHVCAAGIAVSKARPLLDGAVAWLLGRGLPDGVRFPAWLLPERPRAEGEPPVPLVEGEDAARSAWCYGHPGIASALHGAGELLGEAEWRRRALEWARQEASRPVDECGVVDACLCHGAAGLGHQYHRLYRASGDEDLAAAARFWIAKSLELQRPGEGVAGFLAWGESGGGEAGWVASPGFLDGAAGVGLALLAAVSESEPAWDRVLLLS